MADVIKRTLKTTPKDATHWSIRSMAAKTGLSHTTIRRIWNAFRPQPHRRFPQHTNLNTFSFYAFVVVRPRWSFERKRKCEKYASVKSIWLPDGELARGHLSGGGGAAKDRAS